MPLMGEIFDRISKRQHIPEMTIGHAVLVTLMHRYLNAMMDPTITLLELQKLMYFMQETGEPLKLHFKKALYGPTMRLFLLTSL